MTKHDWFWVAVKVIGLLLLVYAAWVLLTMVTAWLGVPSELGDAGFGHTLLLILLHVAGVGGVGWWMIRDGSLLLDWAAGDTGDSGDAAERKRGRRR